MNLINFAKNFILVMFVKYFDDNDNVDKYTIFSFDRNVKIECA